MTHDELCKRAERWLRGTMRCCVVIREAGGWETPDALGWGNGSHLVECKTSRSDFAADLKKPFRIHPQRGMGQYRWYMSEPSVIRVADLPPQWGLLHVRGNRVYRIRMAERQDACIQAECAHLISALRIYQSFADGADGPGWETRQVAEYREHFARLTDSQEQLRGAT